VRILCCYANLRPETAATIAEFAPGTELVDVAEDKYGYWRNVCERWTGSDDLLIVEQDMELIAEVVPSFEDCPEQWCLFEYQGNPFMGTLSRHLGCTRFRKELQQAVPLSLADNLRWDVLDGTIAGKLNEAGYSPHVHGEINHLHDYSKDRGSKLESFMADDISLEDFIEYMSYICKVVVQDPGEDKTDADTLLLCSTEANDGTNACRVCTGNATGRRLRKAGRLLERSSEALDWRR
jgi:hypothetical protein